ncbi:MAG: DUF5615 family PIN-like protein [Gemmatimonadota bacterium]
MKLLLDENLSPDFARGLKAFGYSVSHVTFELERGADDQQIYQFCAAHAWLLLTGDWRMHRNKVQRAAMAQAGIGVFILTGRGNIRKDELALFLHRRMKDVATFSKANKPPCVAGIPQKGVIKLLRGVT